MVKDILSSQKLSLTDFVYSRRLFLVFAWFAFQYFYSNVLKACVKLKNDSVLKFFDILLLIILHLKACKP